MGLKIKLVPHPARKQKTIQDGRKICVCPICKDRDTGGPNEVAEPVGHPSWQPVVCDLCGGPCIPYMVPLGGAFDAMCGIELEGSIVGLCHNGPNGFISPTDRSLDVSTWHTIKRFVDKKLGGSAVLNDYPPTFEEHLPADEEEEDEEDDTEVIDDEPSDGQVTQ